MEFLDTMDPHSLNVTKDGRLVACLVWHNERRPMVIVHQAMSFNLDELRQVTTKLAESAGQLQCAVVGCVQPSRWEGYCECHYAEREASAGRG